MRIIHFSDTHLGFSDYTKIDHVMGINLKEADVYRAFSQVIDYIRITPPDLILHSGDLFETARPSNKAINFAIKEIAKISHMKIPFVLISGNHSTPRVRTSGSIFEAFEIFDNIYPVYKSKYEEIIIGETAVHCIPHMSTEEEINAAFETVKPNSKTKYNVIVSHAGVTADIQYKMGEFNELIIPFSVLAKKSNFDYIALGHYHKNLKLTKNAYYAGSTERFSFSEAGQKKGFLEVDLTRGLFSFIPIEVRDMIICNPINCQDLAVRAIENEIEQLTKDRIKEKIVQVTFDNIHKHQYVELNFQRLKEMTADAVHVNWVYNWAPEKSQKATQTTIGALTAEFESFIQRQDIKDLDKNKLKKMGADYLRVVQELEEA